MRRFLMLLMLLLPTPLLAAPTVVIAEGEQFTPKGGGWKVTPQDDSYASHTYGGMWMTHGGCLGAAADVVDAVATQTVQIPQAGSYRVWSKYQAPPYFNYLHRIEIHQNGKRVYGRDYGKVGTPRLWSFSGVSDELWWYWGVDHDAAEAPREMAALAAGPAEIRLIALRNPAPAGNRFVDFVVLTTEPNDTYIGFKPYQVGSPFANEALAATRLYARFRNATAAPAQLTVSRGGHFQPNYGGATEKFPAKPVAAGAWSEWFNIGPFCRLVHDEGLTLTLPGSAIEIDFARDPAGKDNVGTMTVASGEVVCVPIDITWRKEARVVPSKTLAEGILRASKSWRASNAGKKPQKIRFYGAFAGIQPWVHQLKDGLGYNTALPDGFSQIQPAIVAAHHGSVPAIRQLHASLTPAQRKALHVVSFGDEISLGKINYADPKLNATFRAWLARKGVTAADLGTPVEKANLAETGRLAWYSNLFNEEERFAAYREMTDEAKKLFGPQVLTGANYSPHHLALCYGPVFQWVDVFKHRGMSMMWAEDYIFSVPEVPQMVSWMFAQMRCGVKYHQQPIHFYVMPHAPGQVPGMLRRNLVAALGFGTAHVDNFWVAPAEGFTENYVSWHAPDTFRVLRESILDAGEIEKIQVGGKVRPGRVAVVIGKATDFNESRLMRPKSADAFLQRCANAPDTLNQTLCRKDQQYLYLALRQAQHGVELITEDDIADGTLAQFDVVYFAGEWIERRTVQKLAAWVKDGGVLYAAAGLGHRNEFDEPSDALLALLGLKSVTTTKNAIAPRTLLELPLATPIDTLTLDGKKIAAYGLRQTLVPTTAKVLGTWADGTAAVTVQTVGKGQAFAVGTLPGASYLRTGLKQIPYARGGRGTVYNPTGFDPAATSLVRLAVDARKPAQPAVCSVPGVEAIVLDHPAGTLLTLVNWTDSAQKNLSVRLQMPYAPKQAWSVTHQKEIARKAVPGGVDLTLDLAEGDFILLPR
ncbi:MAG: beta-galactosidase trimerization domain-containing protein [Gemmataceae bacterium]